MAQTSQEATVWMTYVNIVDGVDEDFRDMKAHGIQGVEINTSPAIWVGDEIEPAQALECARRHSLQLAFTIENITLRADRIASHGITPTPCVMIGGVYEGEAIDWHRFSFTPQRHEILIEKPIFGADWTLGNGSHFAELLPPHHAEVIVKEKDYDGAQHLLILPATIEPRDEHTYLMEFDLTGARGDLDNVMLAVYWRMRGPIYEQPQPSNYFGNTASPHAAGTVEGFCAQIKQEIARWTEANGGTFPSDVVMGIRLGDEDFLQTVPNGPANPAQSMPLWDYSDDAIADFERLNPDDTYPRHWTYREAFGERAYADWMWSLHRACAGLLRAAKDALCQERLGALRTYRNLTRCNSFYVGNDHGGMSLDMAAREIDIVSADPYPASDRGFNDGSIPGDMGYVAGLARRHGKELMPWMQGHEGRHPSPAHLNRIYEQHTAQEPTRIMYLGYGNTERPPVGTDATFPDGNVDSWELARELNMQFQRRTPRRIEARVAALRDYHVWSLNGFGQDDCLDRYFAGILDNISVRYGTHYDPIETRSLDELNWKEVGRYTVVIAALPRTVKCWRRFAELAATCILLASDCETLAAREAITGVRSSRGVEIGGEVTLSDGTSLQSLYTRCVEIEPRSHTLGRRGEKTCIWRSGHIIYVGARIAQHEIPRLLDWLGTCDCPELING